MRERIPDNSSMLLRKADRIKTEALDKFVNKAFRKYDKGQREHGGLITDRVTLEDLEDEIIDQWFYLASLKKKVESGSVDKNT